MKKSANTDPVPPSTQEDHTEVFALINSAEMQKRLQDARIQRAKILAARKTELPDLIDPDSSGVNTDMTQSVGPHSSADLNLPPPDLPVPPPTGNSSHRRSQARTLVIGLVLGLALGSGMMMWFSGSGLSGFSTATDVAGTPTQAVPADALPSTRPLNIPPADQSRTNSDLEAPDVTQNLERVTSNENAPANSGHPLSEVLPDPVAEERLPLAASEQPPVPRERTARVVDSARDTDGPSLLPIGRLVPDIAAGQVNPPADTATALAAGSPQVGLHLSSGMSEQDRADAEDDILSAGLPIASTSTAGFSVLQSEVRFFHQADALSANRMAQKMGITARDFSAFRPAPAQGTLEVWLAQ